MSGAIRATRDTIYPPAETATMYFVGVTTGQSSIMTVFPRWAEHLGLGPCRLQGIDCRQHDDPEVYRRIVSFLRSDPLSLGALVTTHKLDLLDASRDLFDDLGPHAALLGEVSSISKRDGRLVGHAVDAVTSGLALGAITAPGYWRSSGAEMFLIGAGGSSLALSCHLLESAPPDDRPRRILVSNRSEPRLESMRRIHERLGGDLPIEYHHAPHPEDNDRLLSALPPGSLVANATGLGKDAPGSPLTDAATFPERGIAWDFNYRGDLLFLEQARRQARERNLRIEDGWVYFIHGWTRVIANVFDAEVPTEGPGFEELGRLAAAARRVIK